MTTLRHGDRSQAVQQLQKALNAKGAKLVADGDFGDVTEEAVRAFQRQIGLVDDGIAGEKTQLALTGGDCSRLLKAADLIAAAKRLGVEVAVVYAVNEVESAGKGFLANGKPAILFERHIMYRQLSTARHPSDDLQELKGHADALAVQYPALVNPKAGGYSGDIAEHQRLVRARLIDDLCALESTSWGAFQIMGYHAVSLGYPSVADFVERMQKNESEHLEAFVRFIEADPVLLKALKARKWADFAKRYNGPGYARNLYDVKLERAYKRHADGGCGSVAA